MRAAAAWHGQLRVRAGGRRRRGTHWNPARAQRCVLHHTSRPHTCWPGGRACRCLPDALHNAAPAALRCAHLTAPRGDPGSYALPCILAHTSTSRLPHTPAVLTRALRRTPTHQHTNPTCGSPRCCPRPRFAGACRWWRWTRQRPEPGSVRAQQIGGNRSSIITSMTNQPLDVLPVPAPWGPCPAQRSQRMINGMAWHRDVAHSPPPPHAFAAAT